MRVARNQSRRSISWRERLSKRSKRSSHGVIATLGGQSSEPPAAASDSATDRHASKFLLAKRALSIPSQSEQCLQRWLHVRVRRLAYHLKPLLQVISLALGSAFACQRCWCAETTVGYPVQR